MNTKRVTAGVLLAGMLLMGTVATIGCDEKKSEPAKEPAKPAAPKPPPPDVTPKAGDASASTATTKPTTAPSVTATPGPRDGWAERSKQANDLLTKATQSIYDNKLDDARASLDQVDAMKDSIPPATREKAKTVRATLASVEKIQRVDLPSVVEPENK